MDPEKAAELTQNPEEQQDLQDDQVIEQNLETEVTSDTGVIPNTPVYTPVTWSVPEQSCLDRNRNV